MRVRHRERKHQALVVEGGQAAEGGRLSVSPGTTIETGEATPSGPQPLGLESRRDALLYVPPTYRAGTPAPLVLMLHGAGGNARDGIAPFRAHADAAGMILLAPDSRGRTWDVILGGYDGDVAFINRALAYVFARYRIDRRHLAVEGFSDGASYALSLGLTNGDLFTHIIAFSPGFTAPSAEPDSPRIFVSHGTHDEVLPVDVCSRRIVPVLLSIGYDLTYREFDGSHTVPDTIAREAQEWFLAPAE